MRRLGEDTLSMALFSKGFPRCIKVSLINNLPRINGTAYTSFHPFRQLRPSFTSRERFAHPSISQFKYQNPNSTVSHLARSRAGNISALVTRLATTNANTRPLPPRARALATQNVHIRTLRSDGALDVVNGEASDRDAGGRLAGRRAVLVVLLDYYAVLGDLVGVLVWIIAMVRMDEVGTLTFLSVMSL
jgi:hypothetical protein